MPIEFHTDYVEGIVEVCASGKISGAEILERLEAIFTDTNWKYDMPQIWDGTQVSELDIDFPELLGIRELVSRLLYPNRSEWAKTAVIVSSRKIYIFIRVVQALITNKHSRVFFDRKSALTWIHLSPAEDSSTLIDNE